MKRSTLSWLLGTGLATLAFVALGYATPQGTSFGAPALGGEPSVPFPHPRNMVRVVQGTEYVVPAGKILTLREFVATSTSTFGAVLHVDGEAVFVMKLDFGEHDALELGIVATAGQVVSIKSENFTAPSVAIGFLVDA